MAKINFKELTDRIPAQYGLQVVSDDKDDYRLDIDERCSFGGEDEEEYNQAVEEINKVDYSGIGWKIYASCDESGYHYWMKRMEEANSISLTITFDDGTIDEDEISVLTKAIRCAINDVQQIEVQFNYNPDARSGHSFAVLSDETGEEVRISKRTKYIRTDGWRGYTQPRDAVAGANDTGDAYDSPCPSKTATAELKMLTDRLDQEKILWIEVGANTTNVFCIHRYIITQKKDRARASAIAAELKPETRLLYAITEDIPEVKA
jgi:hypothetical protein